MIESLLWPFIIGVASGIVGMLVYFWYEKNSLAAFKHEKKLIYKKDCEDLERKKRESLLKIKDETHKRRSDFDLEMKKGRIELQNLQHKYQKKEDFLDKRESTLDDRRNEIHRQERDLEKRLDILRNDEIKLKKIYVDLVEKLEKISGMTEAEAKKVLTESLQEKVKLETQKWVLKVEEEARLTAKEKSVSIICTAMSRYMSEQVTLHSSSVIQLPNEDMKGRIIGKEGRNIKALEMATGVEFVIGETPEVITISGFNSIRREIAKRALNKLMQNGRINPTRIEETVEQCGKEFEVQVEEIGQQAVLEFGFGNIHSELVKTLGMLYFRTSYTQNNLEHSKEVAYFSRIIAAELGVDELIAARIGLLHDIGKAISAEIEGPHAIVGGDIAKKYGEDPIVVNAIASHHDDVPSKSIYGFIVQMSDAISASRPGARKETLSAYIKRLEQLEDIANGFDGVKKAYALQAGREIRIIVDEINMSDEQSSILARDIAKMVSETINFPGQIKVNVIREKRAIEYAR
jgi:ribonucrease Y